MQNIADFRLPAQLDQGSLSTPLVDTEILFKKPHRQEFIQAHAEQFPAHVIQWQHDGLFYLVHPELQTELESETKLVLLTPYINRENAVNIWPITSFISTWQATAQIVVECARTQWVRTIPNMAKEAYDALPATGQLGSPN